MSVAELPSFESSLLPPLSFREQLFESERCLWTPQTCFSLSLTLEAGGGIPQNAIAVSHLTLLAAEKNIFSWGEGRIWPCPEKGHSEGERHGKPVTWDIGKKQEKLNLMVKVFKRLSRALLDG